MRPKAYTGKNAPGRATVTLLEWMTDAPAAKWYAAATDGDSVLVLARANHADDLAALVTRWGGELQKCENRADG